MVILEGNVEDLAGVYSFAFLSVLAIFSVGVCLLKVTNESTKGEHARPPPRSIDLNQQSLRPPPRKKQFKRPSLPRDVEAPWGGVILAFVMVLIGLLGNLMGNPEVLAVFVLYVASAGALVLGMQQWTRLLHFLVLLLRKVLPGIPTDFLQQGIIEAQRTPVVFFLKQDDVYVLNKAISYVSVRVCFLGGCAIGRLERTVRLIDHPPSCTYAGERADAAPHRRACVR